MATKDQLINYLSEQGLRPEETEYGIEFRYQMLNYVIRYDEGDDQFFQICMPGIFDVDSDNRVDALEAANNLMKNRKMVKTIITDTDVWLVIEHLIDSTPVFDDFVPRSVVMLQQARECYYEELKNL